ncbi:hypothetical protein OG730_06605 [Streptomyces sp. NBC_01298]|uniref:hypothetical protein n=1 Tax=Streptomyces sp. NBC_01298 TaxID=2903817 RepID=UPI002E12BD1D|nr:hypothetical protein OG730_06605 [Streptomyces sp. NBC_01298]
MNNLTKRAFTALLTAGALCLPVYSASAQPVDDDVITANPNCAEEGNLRTART